MAVSTATVMRTITSIQTIATTVYAPIVDTSVIPSTPVTVTQSFSFISSQEEPSASSASIPSSTTSLVEPTSDSPSTSISTESLPSTSTSSLLETSSDVAATSALAPTTPVFDKQPIPTSNPAQDAPVSEELTTSTTSTSSVPIQTTPVVDETTVSTTSSLSSQPTTTQGIPAAESSIKTTQDSSPETTTRVTSQSVEKAILQPQPSTSTSESASSSFSSSTTASVAPSTFQTSATSTAASSPQSTEASDKSTTLEGDSGITNPQTSFTTATLPGGRLTTISLDATAASDSTASPSETSIGVVTSDSTETASTPVIVGSVVGSIAAISVILILIWLLRRHAAKRRRSTLLTPLSLPPGMSGGEKKKQYEIDAASLGPTPRSTKLAAALASVPKKFGQKLRHSQLPVSRQSPNVNMNRGNSQFMDSGDTHSRHSSLNGSDGSRAQGWWSRVIQNASSDDLLAQDMAERANYPGPAYFPNADGGRLDRESQQRRMSRPQSVSSWTDGAPSPNPFNDANEINGARQNQQGPTVTGNPFADSNSVAPLAIAPNAYAQDVQRPRAQTASRMMARDENSELLSYYRNSSRDSTFEARRNKTHSNPFDLEISRQSQGGSSMRIPRFPVPSSFYDVPRPGSTHTRAESFTSRYTSGAGLQSDWPAPGPVSSRWGSTVGYVPIGHVRSESDISVRGPPGQAM